MLTANDKIWACRDNVVVLFVKVNLMIDKVWSLNAIASFSNRYTSAWVATGDKSWLIRHTIVDQYFNRRGGVSTYEGAGADIFNITRATPFLTFCTYNTGTSILCVYFFMHYVQFQLFNIFSFTSHHHHHHHHCHCHCHHYIILVIWTATDSTTVKQ